MNGSNSTLIEYERFFRDFEQALENAKDVELQKADAYSDTTALFFSTLLRIKGAIKASLCLLKEYLYPEAYAVTRNAFEAVLLLIGQIKYGNEEEYFKRLSINYYEDKIGLEKIRNYRCHPEEIKEIEVNINKFEKKITELKKVGAKSFGKSPIDSICGTLKISDYKNYTYILLSKMVHIALLSISKYVRKTDGNGIKFVDDCSFEYDRDTIIEINKNILKIVVSILDDRYGKTNKFSGLFDEMRKIKINGDLLNT